MVALKDAGVSGGQEAVRFGPVVLPAKDTDPARPPDRWRHEVGVEQLQVVPTESLAGLLPNPEATPACPVRAVEPYQEPTPRPAAPDGGPLLPLSDLPDAGPVLLRLRGAQATRGPQAVEPVRVVLRPARVRT